MDGNAETIHATCVSICGKGVLIRGPSGAGKSDLALRLLKTPPAQPYSPVELVSDDQVHLMVLDNHLIATTAPNLENKLEVRGIGIVAVKTRSSTPVHLVIDACPPQDIPRMPEPAERRTQLCGVSLPRLALTLLEPSAPAKALMAIDVLENT